MKYSVLFFLVLLFSFVVRAEDMRIACVGNSITSGPGDPKTDPDTYPAMLDLLLGDGYDVRNFGVSGRTLLKKGDYPLWDEPAFAEALDFQPNIVTIMLGTNDSKPYNWVYKEEFIPDYIAMIDTFQALPTNPQIYLCIPPPAFSIQWDINDSTITTDIIPMIKQIAQDKNLPTIDFRTPFLDHNELFPDDIHPNKEGWWEFAKIFYNVLTGKTVEVVADTNLAAGSLVLSSSSSQDPAFLVDEDRTTIYLAESESPIVIDLGEMASIDMTQLFFADMGSWPYTIEHSADNVSWNMLVDKSTAMDTAAVTVNSFQAVNARYLRLNFFGPSPVPVSEIKILKAAAVHAPLLSYVVTMITSKSVRLDVLVQSTLPGGYLKYYFSKDGGETWTVTSGYRLQDEISVRSSIRQDQEKLYLAKYFKDGVEVTSDTLKIDWSISAVETASGQVADFNLHQNWPNPFNPSTTIRFDLPALADIMLDVYNVRGQKVAQIASGVMSAGEHAVVWDGRLASGQPAPSGVYFYSLKAETSHGLILKNRKMTLLR